MNTQCSVLPSEHCLIAGYATCSLIEFSLHLPPQQHQCVLRNKFCRHGQHVSLTVATVGMGMRQRAPPSTATLEEEQEFQPCPYHSLAPVASLAKLVPFHS